MFYRENRNTPCGCGTFFIVCGGIGISYYYYIMQDGHLTYYFY